MLQHENKVWNKHVESAWFPCADEGSTPSSSTIMKRIYLAVLAAVMFSANNVEAQTAQATQASQGYFNHLGVGLSLGTTGYGFDFSMPVGEYVKLRTGFSFAPRPEVPMTFGIQFYDKNHVAYSAADNKSKFDRMSNIMNSLTGRDMKDYVEMKGNPTMWNWNVLVDVYPLKNNKHWRVTAGFYLGPSKVAETENKTESMTTLIGVSMYNNTYDKLHNQTRRTIGDVKLIDLGPGYEDVGLDPELMWQLKEKMDNNGRMGVHLGNYVRNVVDANGKLHTIGEPYMMEPDEDNMLKAEMLVNRFKPYLGVGYDGRLVKNNDRLQLSLDAGLMFWGGTPKLITHDGTDLINDVDGVDGKPGRYVDFMSKLKVFPVLSVRFTYTIF